MERKGTGKENGRSEFGMEGKEEEKEKEKKEKLKAETLPKKKKFLVSLRTK